MNKHFFFFSFLLLISLSFIKNTNALTYNTINIEYNDVVSETLDFSQPNFNYTNQYSRNSVINWSEFDALIQNNIYIIGANISESNYTNSANYNLRTLNISTETSSTWSYYAYNHTYAKTITNLYFIFHINECSDGNYFKIILNTATNDFCIIFQKYSGYYRGGSAHHNDNSSFSYTSNIPISTIENQEIIIRFSQDYSSGPNFTFNIIQIYNTAGTLLTSLANYENGNYIPPTFQKYDVINTMERIELTAIDNHNQISFFKAIESDSSRNSYISLNYNTYSNVGLTPSYQSLFINAEYERFYRWTDTIDSFSITNTQTITNNSESLQDPFFEYSGGLTAKYLNKYPYDGYPKQYSVINVSGGIGSTYINVSDIVDDSIETSIFEYMIYTDDWSNINTTISFVNGLNTLAYLVHDSLNLSVWYWDGASFIEDKYVDVFTTHSWSYVRCDFNKISRALDLYLDDSYESSYLTKNYDLKTISFSHSSNMNTYFSSVQMKKDYIYENATSYSSIEYFRQKSLSKSIDIDMNPFQPISFSNPHADDTTPPSIFGNHNDFYFDIEFDFIEGINITFNFKDAYQYELDCMDNQIKILGIWNDIIYLEDIYTLPSGYDSDNIKFAIFYSNEVASNYVQYSLMYDIHDIVLNKGFSGGIPTDDFDSISIETNDSLTFRLKNIYTELFLLYDSQTINSNAGFYFYHQSDVYYIPQTIEYLFEVPEISIPDYVVSNYRIYYTAIRQTTNSSFLNCTFQFTAYLNFTLEDIDNNSLYITSNNSLLAIQNINVEGIINNPSNSTAYYTHTYTLYMQYVYFPASQDIFETLLSFVPNLIILILFPWLLYNRFGKWGFLIGLIASIILLSVVNNLSIVENIVLMSIVVGLIIYLYKHKVGGNATID